MQKAAMTSTCCLHPHGLHFAQKYKLSENKWHWWRDRQMHKGFLWASIKGGDGVEYLGKDRGI